MRHWLILIIVLTTGWNCGCFAQDSTAHRWLWEVSGLNDSWGGGTTRVTDDLRTFGIGVSAENASGLCIAQRFSALTDRLATDSADRYRLDESLLTLHVPVVHSPDSVVRLIASAAFLYQGKIAGASIQDFAHKQFGIHEELVRYGEENFFYAGGGIQCEVRWPVHIGKLKGSTGADLGARILPGYAHVFTAGIPFNWPFGKYTAIKLGLHYDKLVAVAESTLQRRVLESESGIHLSMGIEVPRAFIRYEVFPAHHFSFGTIGLRFGAGKALSPHLELRLSSLSGGQGYEVAVGKRCNLPFLSWVVKHGFGTLLRSSVPEYPLVMGKSVSLTGGTEIELLRMFESIRLYGGVTTGLRQISYFRGADRSGLESNLQWLTLADLGVRYHDEKHPASIRWTLFHRLMAQAPEKLSDYANPNNNAGRALKNVWGFSMGFPF
ncbi:MAG: hypothetical protein JNM00_08280 [Flavobacteriales bacterium]|nr:hypothetical protein [Flavobacteriales bacterium]